STFSELLTSFIFILLDCPGLVVVVILDLPDREIFLLLLGLQLGSLVTQRLNVLECIVLLGLDGIQLSLELVIFVAQGPGLRVVKIVALCFKLSLKIVNLLLGLLKARKPLALLSKVRDLGERLLLINQLHHAAIDLLLQSINLTVNLVYILEC